MRLALLPLLPTAGCAAMRGGPSPERLAEKAAFRVADPAGRCVPVSTVQQARVLDDHTIDFVLRDESRLRASLTEGCSGLIREQDFSYDSAATGRLCEGMEVSFSVNGISTAGGGSSPGSSKLCTVDRLVAVEPARS